MPDPNVSLAVSNITLGAAITTILRPVAKQDDSAAQTGAQEIIRDILFGLNNKRDWKWLRVTTTASVATDGMMTLPSRWKKFYSVIGPNGALKQAYQRTVDRSNVVLGGYGGTLYYVPFDQYDTGTVEFVDHPTASTTFTVRYHRLLTVPSNNASVFDVPESVMAYIIAEGKKLAIAEHGGTDSQFSMWDRVSKERLADLIMEEARQPDADDAFQPAELTEAVSDDDGWDD